MTKIYTNSLSKSTELIDLSTITCTLYINVGSINYSSLYHTHNNKQVPRENCTNLFSKILVVSIFTLVFSTSPLRLKVFTYIWKTNNSNSSLTNNNKLLLREKHTPNCLLKSSICDFIDLLVFSTSPRLQL